MKQVIFELSPAGSQRQAGFYGKAQIMEQGDKVILLSYGTPIIEYDRKRGALRRLWDGYSLTTGRHIFAFIKVLEYRDGVRVYCKNLKQWFSGLTLNKWTKCEEVA